VGACWGRSLLRALPVARLRPQQRRQTDFHHCIAIVDGWLGEKGPIPPEGST
jgi:hypothetical protein